MKRHYRGIGVVATLILLACGITYFLHRAGRNLVQRSELLGDAQGWTFSTGHDPYRWLSETTAFATLDEGARKPFLYDIHTHTTTPLESLGRLFEGNSSRIKVRTWDISSDGTHILWCKWNENEVHTANLTGSEHHKWSLLGRGDVISVDYVSWLKDGHWWIANTTGLNGPDKYEFVADNASSHAVKHVRMPIDRADLLEIADPIDYTVSRGLTIQREVIDKGRRRFTKMSPRTPSGMFDCEIDPSPDRKHLVWHLQSLRVPAMDVLLHKLLPSHPARPHIYCSMWISSIDGSNMHEVGRIEVAERYPQGEGPKAFEWMPDGTRISYICNNKLYAISVRDQL